MRNIKKPCSRCGKPTVHTCFSCSNALCSKCSEIDLLCVPCRNRSSQSVDNDDLKDVPTEQIEKWLLGWTSQLVEYEKYHNRSAIREARRQISELKAEIASRKLNEKKM